MSVLLFLALFLSFSGYSSAQYCICKPGSTDPAPYKKVIDYACGPQGGANCVPIQQNGPCYVQGDIVTVCSYAANSYYQNKKSLGATCDFGGVASPSNTPPSDVPSGCTFPTSGGSVPTGTGTPGTTPGGMNPPGGMNTPGSMNTPGGINTPGGMNSPGGGFNPTGFGPTGSMTDPTANTAFSLHQISTNLVSLSLTLFSGLLIIWV